MPEGKYDRQILRAAREQFSSFGYFGARIDTIASTARVNKRMVYEFCHTKDGLYMIVLSDVSREATERFENLLAGLRAADTIRSVYESLLDLFDTLDNFVRLLAWEHMSTTIHGPRILESYNTILERVRGIVREKFLDFGTSDRTFAAIESLLHGYLLVSAMHGQNDAEASDDTPEPCGIFAEECRILHTREVKMMLLDSVAQLLAGKQTKE